MHRLGKNVVTPTTKAVDHDVPISPEDIVRQGLVLQEDWDMVSGNTLLLWTQSSPCSISHCKGRAACF